MSQQTKDSIFKNNPLCQKYAEVVRPDTLYWNQYPKIEIDSISQLKGITANELAKQALDIRHSKYYSTQPFNLIGSYSENEMRNKTTSSQSIKTKVMVYDQGFMSNHLPKAQTEKCDYVIKSPDISPSIADIWKTTLGGEYSNLYYSLDFDFLRMYNTPSSGDLGGDRRIWSTHNFNSEYVSDDFRYYKAFKKDSFIYVILISYRAYSILDSKAASNFHFPKEIKPPLNTEYKYLLVNLNTNAIEKTGFYTIMLSPVPTIATSYETSYKLIGKQYFLDKITKYDFEYIPNIDHISLRGISFQVDSVISEPSKVMKIKESQADPRKVNYIDQYYSKFIKQKNIENNR
jgi:hypothetical protein